MRFQLEATPAELHEKGEALLEELAKAFSGIDSDLAEALEKALPSKEQELKYPALRGLKQVTDKEYDRMLKRMLSSIGKILDQSVSGASVMSKAFGMDPPDKEEPDPDEEPEEPLEPGDYNPKTDEIVPEPEEKEDEEDEEDEESEKSLQSEPVHDFTKPIAAADERAYERVKSVLKKRGHTDFDFEEGGPLYGYSVNELIELVRAKKAS